MRNIDKKWALFVIATIVCFYGICYTLINSTFATHTIPVDDNFDDINFYRCVIDSYNNAYSLELSYDEMMDYNKLRNLTILECDNKEELDRNKIISIKGIDLISNLEFISLRNTKLSNIDLSKNKKIKSLDLSGNLFVNNLYVYNGNKVLIDNGVSLANNDVYNNITWKEYDKNFIDINLYGMINTRKAGSTSVIGESSLGYSVINNINIINIYSSEYKIDEENNKIFIDDIRNFNIQNIESNNDDVYLEVYFNSMELYVKYNDNILKKFILIERDA